MDNARLRRMLWIGLFVTVTSTVAVGLLRSRVESHRGLLAEYVTDSAGSPGTRVDRQPSTAAIDATFDGRVPERFRARWTGFLVAPRAGNYSVATTSDDGSSVRIDGKPVVDNAGPHGSQLVTGEVRLTKGPHPIVVDYEQLGGTYELSLLWSTTGEGLTPIPAWALWTTPASPALALASRTIHSLPGVGFVLSLLEIVALAAFSLLGRLRRLFSRGRPRLGLVRIAILLGTLLVSLIGAELVVRFVFRNVRSAGDTRTYFGASPVPARVNNYGYRDPDVPAGPHQTYRIIVIGDSITWGQGLYEEERFTDLLRTQLGSRYEVFNFGIPGRNIIDHQNALDRALRLAPDFVLLQLYTNDWEIGTMDRPLVRPLLPWSPVDEGLLRHSALYSLLSSQWMQLQPRLGLTESYEHYMFRHLGDPNAPQARRGFDTLRAIFRQVRASGVQVGAVMFPNPAVLAEKAYAFDYLHDRVQEVCREQQVTCVDLRVPFRARFDDLRDIVVSPLDGHPSASANKVVADELLAAYRGIWVSRD